jgi:hypothetical protein
LLALGVLDVVQIEWSFRRGSPLRQARPVKKDDG